MFGNQFSLSLVHAATLQTQVLVGRGIVYAGVRLAPRNKWVISLLSGWIPWRQDAALQVSEQVLQEGQAHGYVARVLLQEHDNRPAAPLGLGPALGEEEPGVQLGAVSCQKLYILHRLSSAGRELVWGLRL